MKSKYYILLFIVYLFSCNISIRNKEIEYSQVPEYWLTELMSSWKDPTKDNICVYSKFYPSDFKSHKTPFNKTILSKQYIKQIFEAHTVFSMDSFGIFLNEIIENVDFKKVYTPYSDKKLNDKNFTSKVKFCSKLREDKYTGATIISFSRPYFSEDNQYVFILGAGRHYSAGADWEILYIMKVSNGKIVRMEGIRSWA